MTRRESRSHGRSCVPCWMRACRRLALAVIATAVAAASGTPGDATGSTARGEQTRDGFINHGIAAPVAAPRGIMAAQDSDGRALVLAMTVDRPGQMQRGSLLVIDAATGETEQFWYPESGEAAGAPFRMMLASTNRLYFTMGSNFLEFDLDQRAFTFAEHDIPGRTAMSIAEGPGGTIYAGTYPDCHLIAFNPDARQFEDLGPLDDVQEYPAHLAVDEDGWVYAGIGTSRANLVAFDPDTGQVHQLVDDDERVRAQARVQTDDEGQIYGRLAPRADWFRLKQDRAERMESSPPEPAFTGEINLHQVHESFPDGSKLAEFDLPDRRFTIVEPDGERREVTFDYESAGAGVASLTAGHGRVIGNTSHPMRMWVYDVAEDTLEDKGGMPHIGGGNMPDFAWHEELLVAASYTGGDVWIYDPNEPFTGGEGEPANPRHVVSHSPDLHRPRAMLAHSNNRYVIAAGYPPRGLVGGAWVVYDMEAQDHEMIPKEDLLPDHSTVTLRELPDGRVVGGTSTRAPGGGEPRAEVAKLFVFDLETRELAYAVEPVDDASRIPGIEVTQRGHVVGVSQEGELFLFDPDSRSVIAQESLADYGSPLGRGNRMFHRDERGDILLVLDEAIVRVDPETASVTPLASTPRTVTSLGALYEGRLYFASGSELWSWNYDRTQRD